MVSSTTLMGVALTAASALAAPATQGPPGGPTLFALQAKVTNANGNAHSVFQSKYVVAYHTAAGFNDATLAKAPTDGTAFYLNGTTLMYQIGGESYPATVYGSTDSTYDAWGRLEINNSGPGTGYSFFTSFTIDPKKGLIGHSQAPGSPESDNEFGGWRACDWDLNTAQVFFDKRDYKPTLPSNCAQIQLLPRYAP